MKLRYLCDSHRQQLLAEPNLAQHYWQLWMHKGCELYEQLAFTDAIRYLGCAFELADQQLHCSSDNTEPSLARFTYSNICLARAYEQVGEIATRQYLVEYAEACLTELNQMDDWSCRCKKSLGCRADSIYWVNESLSRIVLHLH